MKEKLIIGRKLLLWYAENSRSLPWRETKNPYNIWISEIVLQQTQVKQGLGHYLNFIKRFPDVKTLAEAAGDEVLLYWKGLGYYSRAINLHKAAKQVVEEFGGNFPDNYVDLLKLKGIGKYTAAAIASICFDEKIPAVDGNFYRVLSRVFADRTDISSAMAFQHFSGLALQMMPEHSAGDFNQAVMDLGSQICRPKKADCLFCPLNEFCIAFSTGKVYDFPVKMKKTAVKELNLKYYFVEFNNKFLIRRRGDDFIWKLLYEFPTEISPEMMGKIIHSIQLKHKLTHRALNIEINHILADEKTFLDFAKKGGYTAVSREESDQKSFPKPLQHYIKNYFKN